MMAYNYRRLRFFFWGSFCIKVTPPGTDQTKTPAQPTVLFDAEVFSPLLVHGNAIVAPRGGFRLFKAAAFSGFEINRHYCAVIAQKLRLLGLRRSSPDDTRYLINTSNKYSKRCSLTTIYTAYSLELSLNEGLNKSF